MNNRGMYLNRQSITMIRALRAAVGSNRVGQTNGINPHYGRVTVYNDADDKGRRKPAGSYWTFFDAADLNDFIINLARSATLAG